MENKEEENELDKELKEIEDSEVENYDLEDPYVKETNLLVFVQYGNLILLKDDVSKKIYSVNRLPNGVPFLKILKGS